MFTKNIKDTFTTNLLNTVSGVLGEAKKKKCSEGCECEACEKTEATEGYVPTNDLPDAHSRKVAGKLGALLKREREAKEKKEPLGVKEEIELDEAVEVSHTRYMRSHGKKASGGEGSWMFTHKEYGDAKNDDTFTAPRGKFSDAKKHAQKWAKEKGHRTVYVMEEVEIDEAKNLTGLPKSTAEKNKQYIEVTHLLGHKTKVPVHPTNAYKALNRYRNDPSTKSARIVSEDAEQIDEISAKTVGSYREKAYVQQPAGDDGSQLYKKRKAGRDMAFKKVTHGAKVMAKEEAEQIQEVGDTPAGKRALGRYIKDRRGTILGAGMGMQQQNQDRSTTDKQRKETGRRASNAFTGVARAVDRLTKEEQEFIDTLNDADIEQIDELSKGTLKSYIKKAEPDLEKSIHRANSQANLLGKAERAGRYDDSRNISKELDKTDRKVRNRGIGIFKAGEKTNEEAEQIDELSKKPGGILDTYQQRGTFKGDKNRDAGRKLATRKLNPGKYGMEAPRVAATNEEQEFIDSLNNEMFEQIDLDEARGRPRKAAAKDFTINPNTKEKLMHNNPEHMAKIEKLQKHGILQKPKTEAGQNIMTQLQKAKTSMTGGTMVHFTHGDSKEVSGTHAAKLLDKHAGMKPNEKEAFQKKIGHSHENLKSEL